MGKKKEGEKIKGHDIQKAETISRAYTVSLREGGCFFFPHDFTTVNKRSTVFNAFKTVNGATCETFLEACKLQSLLEDDIAWHHTMEEASVSATPQSLHFLLAIIIT